MFRFEQIFSVSQVSVSIAACKSFSSNSVTNELIFNAKERAFVHAILKRPFSVSNFSKLLNDVEDRDTSDIDKSSFTCKRLSFLNISEEKSLFKSTSFSFSISFWPVISLIVEYSLLLPVRYFCDPHDLWLWDDVVGGPDVLGVLVPCSISSILEEEGLLEMSSFCRLAAS